ncbi:hypothetical protein [Paenibacillus agricola]|uniref:Uncharacterized protein n=1 Tax=Paenibacillus agricola TaxID=2716264 RepID=A0ABX0JEK3_9BACL|nr:hypothetical protein [Paenibacillus agricola]NHN33679.1 hypothetical protein [Paenibacillus agricola]
MDIRTCYISVQAKTIMENQGDAAYEFEIKASQEDIEKLRELFEVMEEYDEGTYIRAHLAGIAYHLDSDNDGYDDTLKEIYSMIAKLGTEETKDIVMKMDLENLGNWTSP